jgi:MerR family Zn(II)-responsive transcriptional regulator of zntA
MLIGELSKCSGLSRDTIRYYEKLTLLAVAERNTRNDYKNYGREALDRLHHIQRLKGVGFTLREIRRLLTGDGKHHACEDLPRQLAQKLERIGAQVAVLLQFKASLLEVQHACNGECSTRDGMPACVAHTSAPKQASKCC